MTSNLLRAQERPNLVFLLSDDQRWDALGAMGHPILRTPHLDRLASRGVLFRNHFVTTSICAVSRASIFSGQWAGTHGIRDFATGFTDDAWGRTYPALLRHAGYFTGFIGKWGVGRDLPESRFDFWRGFGGQGHYYQKRPNGQFVHLTELMGDQSIEFLDAAPRGRPFCLSVSFKAPHVQDQDPRQFLYDPANAALYQDVRIPVPETAEPRYINALPVEVQRSEGRRRWAVRFGTPELYEESVRSYYRLITEMDTAIGRLTAELARRGLADNTVIVFTSDNGFYLGEHGLAGKWLMHEESIRVPLLIFDPRLPAARRGSTVDEMTLNVDLAPTLLAAASLPPVSGMQGRPLLPLVRGERPRWRREWFYEHHFSHDGWIPQTEGIRTNRWKYTRYLDTQPLFEALFDLAADPREARNLAREEQGQPSLLELRERWRVWRKALAAVRPGSRWEDPN
ncbi:MAG: sulfatase [Bryobacterales bacterium]|nr:sulfatase [Bryobacterales bacterium]